MLKTLSAVLIALAITITALAGGTLKTTAAMLPGGSAEDTALREAAIFRNVEGVKAALKKGANASAPSTTGRPITPLGAAAMGTWHPTRDRATDLAKNETAAKLSRSGMSDREIDRHLAVEISKMLFAAGAKLGPNDRTILFDPIANGNVELVGLLIDKGASVTGDLEGYTPTELAKKYGQDSIYELLVSRGGIQVDSRASDQLALVEAAGRQDLHGMQSAIKSGAKINEFDANKITALSAAVRWPTYDPDRAIAILWLLDHGADPNLGGPQGPPLHAFILSNKATLNSSEVYVRVLAEQILAGLLKAGAKVSGTDQSGRTPLHIAAKDDNMRAAEILIKEGAKVMPKDQQGKTPLDYAESSAMIRLLKANGATEQ
jgi:ankyrin repeat protein